MADGYEVDPEALRAASRNCDAAADAVAHAATRLSTAQLVPAALGEVDAAHELAAAFAEFAGAFSDDLRRGSAWVADTANGLVANADSYERGDVL
jgi:hypothetical protein